MTYFTDLHTYLHQSSLLLQAYPKTTRITTKYSQPRKTKPAKEENKPDDGSGRTKREPSATLTLKTYHPESGICLKYATDKAAEVGRLVTGLGRLAKGEIIELPTGAEGDNAGAGIVIGGGANVSGGGPAQGDKMDVDAPAQAEAKTVTQMAQGQQQQGGAAKKKKKSKK